jgi:hypothetical protein
MDYRRNSNLDRPGTYIETDYVEAIIAGLWPDASVRQEVLAFLATSIRFASANGPNAWEVSLFENLVRLNVGQIAVLDCTQERIGIYFLQPCSFSSGPAFSLDVEWLGYKAISKEAGYCVCAPQAIGECPAALREAHLALIREAAARKRGSPWKASHSAELVAHLASVLDTDIPQPSYALLGSENSENAENEVGQGFGDQEENRETEAAAIDFVSRQYRLEGWLVNSVELERCGYDLHCTRGKEEIHVEVKGTRGNGRSVLLTAAELDRGFSDDRFVFVIVAAACSSAPVVTYWPAKEFRQFFTFEAIQYRARLRGGEEVTPNVVAVNRRYHAGASLRSDAV